MTERVKKGEDIANLLTSLGGDFEKNYKLLNKLFRGKGTLGKKQITEMVKSQKEAIKQTVVYTKEIQKLEKAIVNQTQDEQKRTAAKIANLQTLRKAQEDYSDSVDRAVSQNEANMSNLERRMKSLTSVTYLMGKAQELLTEGYDRWFGIQNQVMGIQGRLAQRTGASSRGLSQQMAVVQGLRGTFQGLDEEITGLDGSGAFAEEMAISLRRSSDMTLENANSLLAMGRGFGIGTEAAAQLFRLVTDQGASAHDQLNAFGADMQTFAESIGANSGQLVQDFVDSRAAIASFGKDGHKAFKNAAMMANQFGFETRKIFDMMRGFDTFSDASDNVNQLNAMFGTTLNAFDLVNEQDPAKRLDMVRQELRGAGFDFEHMSRQQIMMLSRITGESEDIIQRVFGEGRSLAQLQEQQAAAAEAQARQESQRLSNQEMMNNLLQRTVGFLDSWTRQWSIFYNEIAEELGPIFEVINSEMSGMVRSLRDWLRTSEAQKQIKQTVATIAQSIRDAARWLREHAPTWDQIVAKAKEAWPYIQKIGEMLVDSFKWIVDNKDTVLSVFQGIALLWAGSKVVSGISSMVSGISAMTTAMPALGAAASSAMAPILAGAAAFAGLAAAGTLLHRAATRDQRTEQERIAIERRDPETLRRLRDFGVNNLNERLAQYRTGNREEALSGSGGISSSVRESVGNISPAEEAILTNSLSESLRNVVRDGSSGSVQSTARWVRERYGPMIDEFGPGFNLERFISEARGIPYEEATQTSTPTTSAPEGSRTSTAPVTTQTATTPTTAASVQANGMTLTVVTSNVILDSRQIGRAMTEISLGGGTA